jgi:hypothetical protein
MRNIRAIKPRGVIATATLLALSVGGFGQKPRAKTATAPTYSTVQIDPTSRHLPRQYQGIDPELLYGELEKRSKESAKGEFETTEAFKGRIARVEMTPLTGNITKDGLIPLAISKESDIFDKVTSRYDADKNELTVTIEMEAPIIGVQSDFDKRSMPLKYIFRPPSTYIGQNAYGAKVRIEKSYTYIFQILIENFRDFLVSQPGTYKDAITVRLNMSPSVAMAVKADLRVLTMFRLREPYFEQGFTSHKPTIAEPKDTLGVYQYLVGDATQFWFYNYATGEIYAKLQPRAPSKLP